MILTIRKRQIIAFIADYQARYSQSPSFKEIGLAVGITSTATVAHQIGTLRDAGLVESAPLLNRTVRLAPDVTVSPDGFISRLIPVDECGRCTAQHPADLGRCPNVGAASDLAGSR